MNYLTEAKNLELDQIKTSIIHSQIISSKPILKQIYADYYQFFNSQLKRCPQGPKVELGSGGGFIKEFMPEIFTSDLVPLPKCDLITSATNLPFQDCSVAAIMLVNVFHHIDNVFDFLKESERILLPGGYLLMIEPANTLLSSFIFKHFHHEPFNPNQLGWSLPSGGRLSIANGALPWIVFCRDQSKFEAEFPTLFLKQCEAYMPFRYIVSGGLSIRQLLPAFMYKPMLVLENFLSPLNPLMGMFLKITLQKKDA